MNFTAFRSPQRAHERLAKAALGVTSGIRTAFLSLRRHPPPLHWFRWAEIVESSDPQTRTAAPSPQMWGADNANYVDVEWSTLPIYKCLHCCHACPLMRNIEKCSGIHVLVCCWDNIFFSGYRDSFYAVGMLQKWAGPIRSPCSFHPETSVIPTCVAVPWFGYAADLLGIHTKIQ